MGLKRALWRAREGGHLHNDNIATKPDMLLVGSVVVCYISEGPRVGAEKRLQQRPFVVLLSPPPRPRSSCVYIEVNDGTVLHRPWVRG